MEKFNKNKVDYSMYIITDEKACKGKDFYECIEESLKGGATFLQLREKSLSSRDFYERALKLKQLAKKYNVPFVINDRIDIALAVDADGVHLGQSDMHIDIAKRIIGEDKIIGISAKNMNEALEAQEKGADYIGVGAIFGTVTKEDHDNVSIEQLKHLANTIKIPTLAIGGVKAENVKQLKNTNIDGICVISDIFSNENCKQRTEDIIKEYRNI